MARAEEGGTTQEVRQLVQQLGAGQAAVRERAAERLRAIGLPALAALREAAQAADPETRRRAAQLVAELAAKARERVEDRLAELHARGPKVLAIADEAVARAFPADFFFAVLFRQFPIARRPRPPLGVHNVFVVGSQGSLRNLTTVAELEAFFRERLAPVRDAAAVRVAVQAWLRISEEFKQDGYFQFAIPEDQVVATGRQGGWEASGKAVVRPTAGNKGEIRVVLTFDAAGKLTRSEEKSTVKAGIRPICQATKLLDPDPLVRRMAEQDLLVMGKMAQEYLETQRAKASPQLRRAMDRIWQRILQEDP